MLRSTLPPCACPDQPPKQLGFLGLENIDWKARVFGNLSLMTLLGYFALASLVWHIFLRTKDVHDARKTLLERERSRHRAELRRIKAEYSYRPQLRF
ncbi:MAG TPA: hypothetical protein DEH78_33335 [Solibacterales bacterium]|nr:hypothetical protein [Bryobacterales bacterium]